MINRLMHKVSVDERHTVETVAQLREALEHTSSGCDDDLDETYVIELLREELSDGSVKNVVSIRRAEPV